jgi:hypothetical protein
MWLTMYVARSSFSPDTLVRAVGDGSTDDSAAFLAMVNYVNGQWSAQQRPVGIYIPPFTYLLRDNQVPRFATGFPAAVRGVQFKSEIKLDRLYPGSWVFGWAECTTGTNYGPTLTTIDPRVSKLGPVCSGLMITGDLSADHQQNALCFYDAIYRATVEDVFVAYLTGHAFLMGKALTTSHGSIQHSTFRNIEAFRCGLGGTADAAAVEVTSEGGSGVTSELYFNGMRVEYSASAAFRIRNRNTAQDINAIYAQRVFLHSFDGTRTGLQATGHVFQLGSPDVWLPGASQVDANKVNGIRDCVFTGFTIAASNTVDPANETFCLALQAPSTGNLNNIVFEGVIGSGKGAGVLITGGSKLYLKLRGLKCTGTDIKVGPDVSVGGTLTGPIVIDAPTELMVPASRPNDTPPFKGFDFVVDASSVDSIKTPAWFTGMPGLGAKLSAWWDSGGTSTFGDARGSGAVDWQTLRSLATQAAKAFASVIAGGRDNSILPGADLGAIGGGDGNLIQDGDRGTIAGGGFNQVGADDSWVPGGNSANTGTVKGKGAWATGKLEQAGDAQAVELLLSDLAVHPGAAIRVLTSDDTNARSAFNSANMRGQATFLRFLVLATVLDDDFSVAPAPGETCHWSGTLAARVKPSVDGAAWGLEIYALTLDTAAGPVVHSPGDSLAPSAYSQTVVVGPPGYTSNLAALRLTIDADMSTWTDPGGVVKPKWALGFTIATADAWHSSSVTKRIGFLSRLGGGELGHNKAPNL